MSEDPLAEAGAPPASEAPSPDAENDPPGLAEPNTVSQQVVYVEIVGGSS